MLLDYSTMLRIFGLPLLVTCIGAIIYCTLVAWYGKVGTRQSLALFFTGIIVITCIFLPFNWSIQHAGDSGKSISIFFFTLNIEGNNFIADFQSLLASLGIPKQYLAHAVVFFLAFLEELAKLTLLILCIRKSLRMPVMIVYIFLAGTFINSLLILDEKTLAIGVGIALFIFLFILWSLLGTPIRTASVSNYIFSIALVALGFAFAENIKYMIDLYHGGSTSEMILTNALLRAFFGFLSHTFFSMVCVALYARGRFAFLRQIDQTGNITLGQKALGWKNYTSMKSIQGFWTGVFIATIIHGAYNIAISTNIIIPAIVLIIGFLFLEFFVLHDLRNNTKYGNIENYLT